MNIMERDGPGRPCSQTRPGPGPGASYRRRTRTQPAGKRVREMTRKALSVVEP
jgi:hypothetical protein